MRAGSKNILGGKMVEFSITKNDAEKLIDTFEGKWIKTREFIGGKPNLHMDVSKGIIKADFSINPTLQCLMRLFKIEYIGNTLYISGKGNMLILEVIE